MRGLDDPSLASLRDPRTKLIVDELSKSVFEIPRITFFLEAAGLSPGDYPLGTAKLAWAAAVVDAAKRGQLSELIARIVEQTPAFGTKLEECLQRILSKRAWYQDDDPYAASFVGPGASRAVIDREELRGGLRHLAADQYRVLLVSGGPQSGKSHTWWLVNHLYEPGKVIDLRPVRVTTHDMVGEVTGEDLASELADKLGLNIGLTPSGELADARARKLVSMIVGHYPQSDDGTRWIILDGLDRPGVQESARDVAKRLIRLVAEGELPWTRLIVTGLDTLGPAVGYTVPVDQIPAIDQDLVQKFLVGVAKHLGRVIEPEELDAWVAEVVGAGEPPRDLSVIEEAVVQLVKSWAEVRHDE